MEDRTKLTSYSASGFCNNFSKLMKSSQVTLPFLPLSAILNKIPNCSLEIFLKSDIGAIAEIKSTSDKYLLDSKELIHKLLALNSYH